jgi:hypothetical protein
MHFQNLTTFNKYTVHSWRERVLGLLRNLQGAIRITTTQVGCAVHIRFKENIKQYEAKEG